MPDERIEIGRYIATSSAPYFARYLWSMKVSESEDAAIPSIKDGKPYMHPTFMVNLLTWECKYHPGVFELYNAKGLAWCLLHELQHLLYDHRRRYKQFLAMCSVYYSKIPPQVVRSVWGIASDLEIESIRWPGLERAPYGVFDAKETTEDAALKEGLLAEDYGKILLDKIDPETIPPSMGLNGNQTIDLQTGVVSQGNGPTFSVGNHTDEETITNDEEPVRFKVIRDEFMETAATTGIGQVSATLQRLLQVAGECKVDWRRELRYYAGVVVNSAGLARKSYRRVKERDDMFFAATTRITPRVVLIVDTSGSMGAGENSPLYEAVNTTKGVVKNMGKVDVLWTSTETHKQQVGKHTVMDLGSCGGTDMRVGIRAAEETRPRPTVIILITDGYTPWPEQAGPVPIILVLIGNCNRYPDYFRRVIRIPS